MGNVVKSIVIAGALCFATSSASYAQSPEFIKNTIIGMINPKSWDGPWWWGLHSAVNAIAVKTTSGKEIRSDRRGARAYLVSFTLVNVGDTKAGDKALVLRAADASAPRRWLNTGPSQQPWTVGAAATTPALDPGESVELSIVVYLDATKALDESIEDSLVQLELSAE